MKGREFKRIWGKPWDYAYLLKLEQHKLREMSKHFNKHARFVGYEKAVKEINLCIELIDVVLECDSRCYCTKTHKVRTYVNTKNYKRFCNRWEGSVFIKHQNKECFKDALRINKALHLYNLIRSYHLMSWWD